ncbi:DUF159-domain-containing protein [Suhomyces tanzawaensis NRRL Y-17324]|uniref:DUF159-domain-containing protein n=1 Tax=Suhomyces tanzawaensis NRRL Y-17324 TaxID=984487 RepID=A0A1E4SLE9_9ASCO|nr:DUF159-domain-containing protein [Suhomyces tanzawaensis NRRL Y-17324]ODV80355.1 DUF159-domain-containing protein [Suhomyces tanzawaensis NRRL Y-17324]
MCGRFALGVNANDLPSQFHLTALLGRGDAGELQALENGIYQANIEGSEGQLNAQVDTRNFTNYRESYNVAPTNTAVIIYVDENKHDADIRYVMESLTFGLVPSWAKPNDKTPVGGEGSDAPPYSKELQRFSGRYFNCRKETLAENLAVWNSSRRKHRCVVPIQGYFEWLKNSSEKIPHFVHSTKTPIIYLAGLYSHNYNYKDNFNINDQYLSSFTIVTGSALKSDTHDLSWLHSRKPIFLKPGTKDWKDWLDPKQDWLERLLDTCLNSISNPAYEDVEGYPVSKDVGYPGNKGPELLERQKSPQKSITLFFKRPSDEDDRGSKRHKKNYVNEFKVEDKSPEQEEKMGNKMTAKQESKPSVPIETETGNTSSGVKKEEEGIKGPEKHVQASPQKKRLQYTSRKKANDVKPIHLYFKSQK